ncbi:hypothetical protein HID58_015392 [Brassica napus]|uniref:Uncharacterized protein n=1 Tax=Brassica napus TaxID=3708 RepID=A0ABQ8DMF7_BRANA|nr:hypothetical protein HID58_015392 [Brassica napus]
MASSILDSTNFHVTKPLVEPPGDIILVEAALTPVDSETVEGSKDGVDNDAHLPLSKDSDLKKVMDTDTSSISPFSRLGAWAQPLKFINPSSLMNSSLESNGEEVARDHWPSLPSQNSGRMGRKVPATMSNKFVAHGLPKPLDRKEDDLRFPWAAKMNPASRNLYRATEPEYLEDGTPKSLAKQSLALVHVTASNIEDVHTPSASVDNNSDPIESSIPSGMEVSLSNTLPADPVNPNEDDLHSLATISILENMCMSPTVICINEPMESPILESAQKLSSVTTPIANKISTVQRDGSRTAEPDFGSNKFALLFSAEEEEDSSDVEEDPDSMDLMTPPGKRILRERPVKPSTKAKEMHWHSTSRGRGNRGRGNRGGHG